MSALGLFPQLSNGQARNHIPSHMRPDLLGASDIFPFTLKEGRRSRFVGNHPLFGSIALQNAHVRLHSKRGGAEHKSEPRAHVFDLAGQVLPPVSASRSKQGTDWNAPSQSMTCASPGLHSQFELTQPPTHSSNAVRQVPPDPRPTRSRTATLHSTA